jgi:hypothetical protein
LAGAAVASLKAALRLKNTLIIVSWRIKVKYVERSQIIIYGASTGGTATAGITEEAKIVLRSHQNQLKHIDTKLHLVQYLTTMKIKMICFLLMQIIFFLLPQ